MAVIKVPLEADYESIARAAGAVPGTARYWNDGRVEVPGVSQAALDAALVAYDHMALMRERKMVAIQAETERRLRDTDRLALEAWEQGVTPVQFQQGATGQYRQALRDLVQTIDLDAIETPEALEAFEPAWP